MNKTLHMSAADYRTMIKREESGAESIQDIPQRTVDDYLSNYRFLKLKYDYYSSTFGITLEKESQEMQNIKNLINSVGGLYSFVLQLKYIDCKSTSEIASLINYSERQTRRIISAALDAAEEFYILS